MRECLLGLIVTTIALTTTTSAQDASASKIRIGTFDSRMVAAAYVRSDRFSERLDQMQKQLAEAKASGDSAAAEKLEAQGKRLQAMVHKQGFGTFPIDNILKVIHDQLESVAKKADVSIIVSKWRLAYKEPSVETVDVTDPLVALFDPSDETRKMLESLRKAKPLGLEMLIED